MARWEELEQSPYTYTLTAGLGEVEEGLEEKLEEEGRGRKEKEKGGRKALITYTLIEEENLIYVYVYLYVKHRRKLGREGRVRRTKKKKRIR